MLKRIISILIMLTIVGQSVQVVADVHQSHQSGSQHLEFDQDHRHYDDGAPVDEKLDSAKTDGKYDCHHCCHCHGVACCAALPAELDMNCDSATPGKINHYLSRVYPAVSDKQFRPPRV